MTPQSSPRVQLGIGAFMLFAGWIAWRYAAVEGPHALVLLAAVLGWLALFSLAALGLGSPLYHRLAGRHARHSEPLDAWPVAAAAGAAALALIAGGLGTFGLLRPWLLLTLLFGAGLMGGVDLARRWRRTRPALALPRPSVPALLVAFGAVLTVFAVATPSPFYDQVHYHLAFPERWLRLGRIEVFPRHSYSYLAANMGLLYTYALAGPGVWAAQAIHWWMGLVAAGGAYGIARKIGAGPQGAAWSVAFLVGTPSFLLSSTWAASDLGVAAFGAAACSMALDAITPGARRGAGWYLLAGALSGAAFGCKYVALTAVVLPIGVILAGALAIDLSRGAGPVAGLLRITAWGGGMVVAVAPWAVRNARLTGNPLYPFLSSVFDRFLPGGGLAEVAHAAAGIAGDAEKDGSLLASLTLRTFDPLGAAGWIGPLWLMLLPLWIATLVFGRRTPGARLLAAGVLAGLAAWTQFHQLGRYLLPLLVLAAAGIGMAWEQLLSAASDTLRRTAVAFIAFVLLWSIQGGLNEAAFTRIACTFGRSDPRALLERYVTYWAAVPIVNEQLPEDATVLLVGEPRSLGLDRNVIVEDPFRRPYLVEVAEQAPSAAAIADLLRARGITHLLYNEQEAGRIARMRGRAGYFAEAAPPAAGRLREFLDDCLERIGEAGPVRVWRLAESCRGPG